MRRFTRAAAPPRLLALCLALLCALPSAAQTQREAKIDPGILEVGNLALSPDGKTLAYTTHQGLYAPALVIFCDAKTGKQTDRVELGRKSLHRLVLAYSPDGKSILASTGAGRAGDKGKYGIVAAHVIDAVKNERTALFELEEGDGGCIAFAGDGKTLVTTSRFDRGVALYDVGKGKRLAVIAGTRDRSERLAVSADGKWAVTGHGPDGTVVVWDLANRKEVRAVKTFEKFGLFALAISPKGDRFVASSQSRELAVWDTRTGEMVRRNWGGNLYSYLSFGPEGKSVVAAGSSRGRGAIVWGFADGVVAGESREKGNSRGLNAASADGKMLATYDREEGIRFWDLPSVEEVNKRKK